MNKIKVQCPAKINLDLKVFKKDNKTGFHPIKSVMQAINLFDYITLELKDDNKIILSGTSEEIPYDEKNICYKAVKLFQKETDKDFGISIFIEKNIPVCAGLAGGSTDASGVIFGLNKLFNNILDDKKINNLLASLGSDLNFCLAGGTKLCTSRGEELKDLPFEEFDLSLVKPKNLKISAGEAYSAFDNLKTISTIKNDLEFALLDKYEELRYLHNQDMQMSGSGPTFFIKKKNIDFEINKEKYQVIENLKSIKQGVDQIIP